MVEPYRPLGHFSFKFESRLRVSSHSLYKNADNYRNVFQILPKIELNCFGSSLKASNYPEERRGLTFEAETSTVVQSSQSGTTA